MVSNPALRILRLRILIDHPRTGTEERAAAQRMLNRILAKPRSPLLNKGRNYGIRHARVGRHAGLGRIAEMIGEDIVLARSTFSTDASMGDLASADPIGDAPAEIVFDVDAPFDSQIVVSLKSVPEEWGWKQECGVSLVSPALQALADELAVFINSYNHDGSDIAKRFYGKVCVGGETLAW